LIQAINEEIVAWEANHT